MKRGAIVRCARSWIGTPYHHQAALRGVGCDCVGLIRGVMAELRVAAPRVVPDYSPDWGDASGTEGLVAAADRYLVPIDPADARAGDVVGFRWRRNGVVKHCGILTTREAMVHAIEGAGVQEVTLSAYRRRLAVAYRLPGVV